MTMHASQCTFFSHAPEYSRVIMYGEFKFPNSVMSNENNACMSTLKQTYTHIVHSHIGGCESTCM